MRQLPAAHGLPVGPWARFRTSIDNQVPVEQFRRWLPLITPEPPDHAPNLSDDIQRKVTVPAQAPQALDLIVAPVPPAPRRLVPIGSPDLVQDVADASPQLPDRRQAKLLVAVILAALVLAVMGMTVALWLLRRHKRRDIDRQSATEPRSAPHSVVQVEMVALDGSDGEIQPLMSQRC